MRPHLKIPSITIDTLLNPISHYIFLNIYTAPVFWFLIAPIIFIPLLPLLAVIGSWIVGAMCVSLIRFRAKKATKLDWKNEIVVITGGDYYW